MKVEFEPTTIRLMLDPRDPHYVGYRVQLSRARRWLKRLYGMPAEPLTDRNAEALLDDIFVASTLLHHMQDWVGREEGIKENAEFLALRATPRMMAVRDLCDGSKHRGIDRKTRFPGPLLLTATGELEKDTTQSYLQRIELVMGHERIPVMQLLEAALADWVAFAAKHLALPLRDGQPIDFTVEDLKLSLKGGIEHELSGKFPPRTE